MSKSRLEDLQKRIMSQQIDAFLLSNMENIRYITGFTGTSALTLVKPEAAFFLTDSRYTTQAGEQVRYCHIVEYKKQWEELIVFIKSQKIKRLAFESAHLTFASYAKLKDNLEDMDFIALENLVEGQRMIKDQSEIASIIQAISIAKSAYGLIQAQLNDGAVEKEIALELEYQMLKAGADQIPFETIVASGFRGAMPHGLASSKKIRSGELITIDFGARYHGYCSDCTRTVQLGKISSKEAEMYRIVDEANRAARQGVKPGKKAKEIDALARDIIKTAGYGEFFGHGTGHGIGLAVHEDPRISWESELTIESGMVFTIEPGIYIPGEAGVRIEDMVLVTDTGCQTLTIDIEKEASQN